MPAPTIYRSSDANAPILTGAAGSALGVLNACLVNGYGSVRATATITSSGVTVANNDTITIDGTTYTWKTALTPAANEVLIGASAATNLSNLAAAIGGWGVVNTNYGTGTAYQRNVQVTGLTATVLTLSALRGGTGGNSIALANTAANITLSGATLAGGSGTDTKAPLGWTSPFTTTNGAVYQAPAGTRMFLQVLDNASGTGLGRDALCYGWETMSAWNTGSGEFPTTAQVATVGCVLRKSSTVDQTARFWMLIGDDRTFYLFVISGDSAGVYMGFSFGDYYSLIPADPYKTHIQGQSASQTTAWTTGALGTAQGGINDSSNANSFIPRNYAWVGGSTCWIQVGDPGLVPSTSGTGTNFVGFEVLPNQSDGGLYLARIRIIDPGTPGVTMGGSKNYRGYRRGLYHAVHQFSSFADGDTVNGSGVYAGRTFLFVKPLLGANNASMIVVETTQWDTSS